MFFRGFLPFSHPHPHEHFILEISRNIHNWTVVSRTVSNEEVKKTL